MTPKYTVLYINTDELEQSEIIGTYNTLHLAVENMIKAAHYDEFEGELRQYRRPTTDYPSYQYLYNTAMRDLEICDYDIYKIIETSPEQ
jgi:hypothetical protein